MAQIEWKNVSNSQWRPIKRNNTVWIIYDGIYIEQETNGLFSVKTYNTPYPPSLEIWVKFISLYGENWDKFEDAKNFANMCIISQVRNKNVKIAGI